MKLEFKPDFEQARQNWDAFWKGGNKRPPVWITLPKPGVTPPDPPAYLEAFDGDFEPVIDKALAWGESYDFLGDTIPAFELEFGPDTFSSYLGADLRIMPGHERNTSWCVPFVKDWDDVDIKFRRDSYWWLRTEAFIKAIRARCDGKLLIKPPTLVANLDSLAAIRGIENLLADLTECPDKVKHALSRVCDAHTEIMQAYAELLDFATYGSINIEGFYTSGRHSRPQCDMSCMISPAMFREFVVPALEREAADADTFIYHLDGPDALQHLDALLEIDRLDFISFVPGVLGKGKDWSWVEKKAIDNGLAICRTINDHDELKRVCANPPTRRIIFETTASSKTEAEDLIADMEKIWAR